MSPLEESPSSVSIAENVQKIREGIRQAALRAGRDPSTVQLVAATKTVSASLLIEAYEAGVRIFGENRLQEAQEKKLAVAHAKDWPGILLGACKVERSRIL